MPRGFGISVAIIVNFHLNYNVCRYSNIEQAKAI